MSFTEGRFYNKNLKIKRIYTIITALSLILVIFNFSTITEAAEGDETIRINEIMYNPEGPDEDHEWIEIHNYGLNSVDISNWELYVNEFDTNYPINSFHGVMEIPPDEYAIISDNPQTFLQDYPEYSGILTGCSFSLPNFDSTEYIALKNDLLEIVNDANYPTLPEAYETGKTLELDRYDNWEASPTKGGTPGEKNNVLKPILLEKTVWDGNNWEEVTNIQINDKVRFKINITYNADAYSTGYKIYDMTITDYLPDTLIYDNNATTKPNSVDSQPTYISPDKHTIKWELPYYFTLYDEDSFILEFNATVVSGSGTSINRVNFSGFETCPHETRYAEDTAEINIKKSEIKIEKNANKTIIHKGDSVKYTYYVNNTGDLNLTNIVLTDDKISSSDINFISGDTNSDGWLNTTETWLYEAIATINSDTTNIGNVTGETEFGTKVYSEDTETVNVITSNITITKTATPDIIHKKDTVTWNITVENTGTSILTNVNITDTKIGDLTTGLTLNPQEKYYHEYTTNPSIATINNATVNATDPLGHKITDSDNATVDVINSSINVTKTANISQGYIGDKVNYTITVKNTGEDTLYNIYTNDTKLGITKHLNRLNPTQTKTYYFEYILRITPNPFINTVEAEGKDILGKRYNDTDTATVDIINSTIKITKTVNKSIIYPGNIVLWNITVENTGTSILSNVNITDTNKGDLATGLILNPQEKYYHEYTTNPTTNITNTAIVNATDPLGYKLTDSDTATVTVINPDIKITKTANKTQGYIGDTVNYTITVQNTGKDPLYNVYVNDTTLGISYHIPILNSYQTKTYYKDYILTESPDPFINTVETEGYDILGKKYTDTDTETVDVIQSNIKVVKTATPTIIHKNELVTWNITVENIGLDTLTNVNVTDDTGVLIDGLTLIKDQIWYHEYTTNPIKDTTNHVLVNGTDPSGNYVTNTSSASVNVINSSISINKTVNPTKINKGQTVEYTYEIKNTGECNLTEILVTDNKGLTPQYKSGDTNSNNWLDTTETWIYNVTTTIDSDTTNIGNVTAIDILGSTVTDEDDASVDVIDTNLTVTKTANTTKGHVGDEVNYTITVENTGLDPLYNVYTNDTTLGIEYYLSTLNSGQTKTYYKDYILTQNPDPFINTVEAEGYDELGKRYNDTDTATVDIINGSIKVTKTANINQGYIGDKVNYTITVENTGEDILYNIYTNDTKLGLTKYLTTLNSGQTKTYYAEYTLQETPDPYINIVETEGYDILGKKYTDTDTETVDVITSNITITKTATADKIHKGDTVTWNITVENTGTSTLTNVNITDTNKGDLATGLTLNPGQKKYYEYTTNPTKNITNTAIVNATDPIGYKITDSDTAKVTVIDTDIKITKTANITTGYIGDEVNYTIKVENTGLDPLYDVYTNDTQLDFYKYIDQLNPGKNVTYYVTHTLKATPDPYINTAETEGYDELGKRYNDTDTETVYVKCRPDITVDKKAWDGTKWVDRIRVGENNYPEIIRFNITITNTGTCDLVNVTVKDVFGCGLQKASDFTIAPIEPISIIRRTYTWFFDNLYTNENIFIEFNATADKPVTNTVTVEANSSTTTETTQDEDTTSIVEDNTPPLPQKPEGKTEGYEGIEYEFNFTATDLEGDNVSYMINWGDGTDSGWTDHFDSGEKITKTHSWSTKGTYDIKLKANDSLGAKSDWSDPLTIEILDDNNPPVPQKPEGKTSGFEDIEYEFNFTATDPEGDDVYYRIDWGDSVSSWYGPFASGEKKTLSHSWSTADDYDIILIAKDSLNAESWSQPLTIEITHVNAKPNKPDNPSPGHQGKEIETNPVLSVDVSDPDGDTITVKFYNGKNDNLIGTDTVTGGSGTAQVTWTGLSGNKEYEWYAEAEDSEGEISLSDVWSFTTVPSTPGDDDDDDTGDDDDDDDDDTGDDDDDEPEVFNNPPEIVNFTGNLTGDRNQTLNYSALAIDLDDHDIKYEFDWDGGNINTTEYVENNTIYNITHKWSDAGIYEISVRAFDDYQDENGTWSAKEYLEILIDTHIIDDEENDVDGYLTDDKGNDSYDNFHNTDGAETAVEKDGDYYLIDTDGDGEKDYRYNPLTGEGSKIKDEEEEEKEGKTETLDENVIYYLAGILIIIALLLILFFITRKKEKK